jgi:excisionase family DNA binding protein
MACWRNPMPENIIQTKDAHTILTVREVAEYLRISEAKVYRLVKERSLPVVRIGKAWRFRKDLLDEWLSQCTESNMKADDSQP